jgi:sortase (surface protein transpeptidase)
MSGHRFRLTIFKKLKLDHHQMLLGVTAMAFAIFVIGVMLSLQTASSNQHAAAQVSALFKESRQAKTSPAAGALITARPSSQALDNYFTAPDLPRYISIPSLILNARVLQADPGINSTPEMPRNIHDTGWYTASAKPGQPGAMLIVGRESANNTRGVFNRLGEMKAGDQVKLVRGDNTAITYQVVKSQLHSSGAIDMQAALSPVLADKPGLNLTNCETTPEVKNQVGCTLVYASQM